MNEKGTKMSQLVAASACAALDLERIVTKLECGQEPSEQDLEKLKKSTVDYRRIIESYKRNPIDD